MRSSFSAGGWRSFPRLTVLLAGLLLSLLTGCGGSAPENPADVILFGGRIITLDSASTIAQAVAIRSERIMAVGSDRQVRALQGPQTTMIDLGGRTVVPGLIEAHAHPEMASLSELAEPLPNPRTVAGLLEWIKAQADSKADGEWIIHPKLFATRLRELRPPTLEELDAAAPANPVFLNGSFGGSINSAAMRASGIEADTRHEGLLRDKSTGKLNGILRFSAFSLLKLPSRPDYTAEQRAEALAKLLALYNRVGFTSVTAGQLDYPELALWQSLRDQGRLTLRVFANIMADFPFPQMTQEEVDQEVANLGPPTRHGDEWVRTGPLKVYLDGGILTGTAFMSEPWGTRAREIFGIEDPEYRGIPRFTTEDYAKLCLAGARQGWKMTGHATGDGALGQMLDAFEQVNREVDIRPLRFSIIHGNFFSEETIARMVRLNVIADAQPAWFYKDADAMLEILGPERVDRFHPYRALLDAGVVVSTGSDHMVILDDLESINPYNPWLAIYAMVTRRTERGTVVNPEQAISREEALRCYTVNNAWASFEEELKGSLEPGKLADLAVLDQDFFQVPDEQLKEITVALTMVGGKVVYEKE